MTDETILSREEWKSWTEDLYEKIQSSEDSGTAATRAALETWWETTMGRPINLFDRAYNLLKAQGLVEGFP